MAGEYRYNMAEAASLPALGEMLLRAAGEDADTLGFGVSDLRDLGSGGASWVLSRLAVELARLPCPSKKVAVYTWVSDYGRMVSTRNMVLAVGGEQIGAAVTQWAMIDLDTRRPLDLASLAGKSASLLPRPSPIAPPRRIAPFEAVSQHPHRVGQSDIDFNGHAGSMKYLEWVLAVAALDGVALPETPIRLDVNYLHEARLGDQLTIGRGDDGKGGLLFDIRGATGTPICKIAIAAKR